MTIRYQEILCNLRKRKKNLSSNNPKSEGNIEDIQEKTRRKNIIHLFFVRPVDVQLRNLCLKFEGTSWHCVLDLEDFVTK